MEDCLAALRQEVDRLDDQIAELFLKRMEVTGRIGACKEELGLPLMDPRRELEVRSPLRECGLTKADIRRLSREAGLFTWDKPAYACLATRLPTGDALTEDLLARVEGAEDALFRLGYADFRVRVFHGAARLQLPAGQLERAVRERAALQTALAPDFKPILLDLEER